MQPGPDERKSELLPAGWEANKEVYTLRYKSTDDARELLLKAIMVEDSMILNVMVSTQAGPCGLGVLQVQRLLPPKMCKQQQGPFLTFLMFLAVMFVPQDGADPGGVRGVEQAAMRFALRTLAQALPLLRSLPSSGFLCRSFLLSPTSTCPGCLCFHPLQSWLEERAGRASLCTGVCLLLGIQARHRDVARGRQAHSGCPKPPAVVIPAPSLIPSSAGLLILFPLSLARIAVLRRWQM